jgi:ATP-dependent DNA helicase RecG
MTKEELYKLLNELRSLPSETEWVEFKKAANSYSFNKLGRYFSALGNEANLKQKQQGWLIFGVEDKTRVIMFQIPAAPRGIPVAWEGHYYGRDGESLGALNIQEIEQIRNQDREYDWSAQI